MSIVKSPIGRQTRSQTKELISAFEKLDMQQAMLIMDNGADPTVLDPRLLANLLWHAVKMQNAGLVRELLMYKPPLKTDKEPMLMLAVRRFNPEIALMLIDAGADVNEADYLHAVAMSQSPKMHSLAVPLMEHGAKLDGRDAYNRSIIFYAVETEALDILEEVLRRGARISHGDNDGKNVLRMAANSLKAPQILKLLFDYGCVSFETRDDLALMAMCNFIEHEPDYVAEIKMLLDQGVPVDQTDNQGATALHYAAAWNRIRMVELLLAYGANVNQKTYRGTTPLMLSVKLCESTIAVLLIKRGANIHDCNNSCRYPIHVACDHGSTSNIKLLLSLDANVDVIDEWDYTPFALLCDSPNENLDIFLKHFALLTANGISLNATDLATIQSNRYSLSVYNTCLKELQRMKDSAYMKDVTYFDIINGKLEKLSLLTKNAEFVHLFYRHNKNASGVTFHWLKYNRELHNAFRLAEKRRNLLITKEVLVQNAFGSIFPQIILDKIARILVLDEFNYYKRHFYLSPFST